MDASGLRVVLMMIPMALLAVPDALAADARKTSRR
jgi:hypothetical protein